MSKSIVDIEATTEYIQPEKEYTRTLNILCILAFLIIIGFLYDYIFVFGAFDLDI